MFGSVQLLSIKPSPHSGKSQNSSSGSGTEKEIENIGPAGTYHLWDKASFNIIELRHVISNNVAFWQV